jgi:hypothetical protein
MRAESIELVVDFKDCCEDVKIKFNLNCLKKRKEHNARESKQR